MIIGPPPKFHGTRDILSTRTHAGVTYKLHELRHYFAGGLIAAGCDVVTISEQ